jgi:hypothetical protein
MRLPHAILALAGPLIFSGCVSSLSSPVTYYGTVERVTECQGEFISPIKGYRPLYSIYVEVDAPAKGDNEADLEIRLLDFYLPEIYGKAGDRVGFRYFGKLPIKRELDFDSLVGYFVIRNRG